MSTHKEFITIGTGGLRGLYYPTGGTICRLVNKTRKKHGIRCSVESTGGSVDNLATIAAGKLDLGIARSDWQYHAYHGTSTFSGKGNKNLRAILSIYPEPLTVIARADSGIKNFQDLKGKRVNIGNPGSGQRKTMNVLMSAFGWTKKDFKLASELKFSEQPKALCENKLDAIIFTVAHPSGSTQKVSTTCDTVLVNVTGPEVEKLIEVNDYYAAATIPGGMYRGSPHDTTTFGLNTTMVSDARVSEDLVYNVVKALFDNFSTFKRLHPAFANLKKENMIKNALSAPLHRGALKYYKEAGLIK
ncbi:TAXI family TRAP transporter solute-binding subunit [Desulfomarina sp.]